MHAGTQDRVAWIGQASYPPVLRWMQSRHISNHCPWQGSLGQIRHSLGWREESCQPLESLQAAERMPWLACHYRSNEHDFPILTGRPTSCVGLPDAGSHLSPRQEVSLSGGKMAWRGAMGSRPSVPTEFSSPEWHMLLWALVSWLPGQTLGSAQRLGALGGIPNPTPSSTPEQSVDGEDAEQGNIQKSASVLL